MKTKFIFTLLIAALLLPAVAYSQNYFEDTVWTKKTDQYSGFYMVKFSNNDSIIVGHGYQQAIFYNAFNGEEIARLLFNAEVHFIDNDSKFLQLAPSEKEIVIYDTKTLIPLDTLENDGISIGKFDITSDEKYIVGIITNGLRIWDLQTKTIVKTRTFENEPGLTGWSSRQIKVLCNDIEFLILEAKTYYNPNNPNKPLIRGYQKKYSLITLDSLDTYNNSRSFRISNNCQYLAYKTGDPDYGVEIYDFNTKQLLHRLPVNGPSLTGIEFSPDDKYIVTSVGLSHRSLKIWDLMSGIGVYEFNDGGYENFDISHSGKYIISSIGRHLLLYPFKTTSSTSSEDENDSFLYPNPATGEVAIDIDTGKFKDAVVKVYDMRGQCMLAQDSRFRGNDTHVLRIDVSSLPAGAYILVLQGKNNSQSYKLIINR